MVSSGKLGVGGVETKKGVNFDKTNGDSANNEWGIKTTIGVLTKCGDVLEAKKNPSRYI